MAKKELIKKSIKRSLNSSQLRSIQSVIEKSIFLVENMKYPVYPVSNVLEISPSKVYRALKSNKEQRAPGINGHPTLFSEEEELLLVKKIIDKYRQMDCLTYHDIRKEVFKLHIDFLSILTILIKNIGHFYFIHAQKKQH